MNPTALDLGFLRRLAQGERYDIVVTSGGTLGEQIAVNCLIQGWINNKQLTQKGRDLLAAYQPTGPIKTNKFEVVVLAADYEPISDMVESEKRRR